MRRTGWRGSIGGVEMLCVIELVHSIEVIRDGGF